MKKLSVLVLLLIMVLGNMSISAFAEENGKAGSTNIKAIKAEPELEYTIVIPTATTLNDEAHTNVLLGGETGKASIDVTTHNSKTNVYYTVDLTNATLKNGTNTIATTYAYKQGDGEYTTLTGTTKVTVYSNKTVTDSTVQVTAGEDSWEAADPGTYTASVVFNFGTEEVVTIGDVLATVDGGFPTKINPSWCDDENFYYCLCFNESGVDKLGFYQNEPYELLASFKLSEILTAVDGGYKFEDGDDVLTFMMTSNKLTLIEAAFDSGSGQGSGTYAKPEPA